MPTTLLFHQVALRDPRFSPLARIVLNVLREYGGLWTEPMLAEEIGVTRGQTRQAIASLRAEGVVRRQYVLLDDEDERPTAIYRAESEASLG